MNHLHLLRLIYIVGITCSLAGAVDIQKNDDTTVSGDITSIADGQLTVTAKPNPVVISLKDISQIRFKAPAPVVVPAPSPQVDHQNNSSADDTSGGLWGTLFGSMLGGNSASSNASVNANANSNAEVDAVFSSHFNARRTRFRYTTCGQRAQHRAECRR